MYLQHPNAFNYPHKLCLTHRHLKIQIFDLSKCCVLRLGGWENQPAAMLCSHSEANVKLLPKSFKWRLTWHMLRSLIGGARNYSIHGHALTNNDISLKGTLIYFGLLLNRLVRHSSKQGNNQTNWSSLGHLIKFLLQGLDLTCRFTASPSPVIISIPIPAGFVHKWPILVQLPKLLLANLKKKTLAD